MRLRSSIVLFALIVIFGLPVSLIPFTAALGENTPVCQGNSTSTASLTLAGRVITPSLVLQAGSSGGQPCPGGEKAFSVLTLARTVVISPVGTAAANGTALLSAMDVISNASPSATNPWLLKLEPGNYDLNGQTLTMLPYVDLEGSGEGTTVITSTFNTGGAATSHTLDTASNSEIRFLSVMSNSSADNSHMAIFIPATASNVSVNHVTATSSGGTNGHAGLTNMGTNLTVRDSNFSASGGVKSSGKSINTGLINYLGTVTIWNSTLTATGDVYENTGVYNSGASGKVTIHNSTLKVSGSADRNEGIFNANDGPTTIVQNSTLITSGGTSSFAFDNFGSTPTAIVQNSILTSTGIAFRNDGGGTANVGASQLNAPTASSGLTKCPASYNANFVLLDSNCQ